MLILVETPAGYGLFRLQKSKLAKADPEDIAAAFETSASAQKTVALQSFSKFADTKKALKEATALIESKLSSGLKKFLKKNIVAKDLEEKLAICDKALGAVIKKKLGIDVVFNPQTAELIRGIRGQLSDLVDGLSEDVTKKMALSLSHTLNRFKLKFSPEKVDIMIVQAVGLLDDLDRELNNFAMRLKEWYGWHFPELAKIVTDNVVYAQATKAIGFRSSCHEKEFGEVLPDGLEEEVKQAAEVSMGTEITEQDLLHINELADRVIDLSSYRAELAEYLRVRMEAVAPNLTYMVGELIGARLLAHAGSLMALAKHPSSTVQILGAEKALFRALKNRSQTPKYGLIYHAALVGQSAPKFKGKVSRVLAAKLSLCIRMDALGDETEPTVAIDCRRYVEKKLDEMQDEGVRGMSKLFATPPTQKYVAKKLDSRTGGTNDIVMNGKTKAEVKQEEEEEVAPKKDKKDKKSLKTDKKKDKKRKKAVSSDSESDEAPPKKKKSKKSK